MRETIPVLESDHRCRSLNTFVVRIYINYNHENEQLTFKRRFFVTASVNTDLAKIFVGGRSLQILSSNLTCKTMRHWAILLGENALRNDVTHDRQHVMTIAERCTATLG